MGNYDWEFIGGGIDQITGSEVSVEAIRHLHEHFRPKLIEEVA